MTPTLPWWDPQRHADRGPFLAGRLRIKRAIRQWFEAEGFVEVEAACLQVSPGNEAHLHAFATDLVGTDLVRRKLYLHTSPEFAMKKLLAAGERKIFCFTPAFRNRERGPLHHPEFTLLEWYRAAAHYTAVMADCAALMGVAAEAVGSTVFRFRQRDMDPFTVPDRLTVSDSFRRYSGLDPLPFAKDGLAFAKAAREAGLDVPDDYRYGDTFSRILVERVEPHLGLGCATFLYEYPGAEAALARPDPADPRVAERFELYACGVELANGFGELRDPAVQRRRFEAEEAERWHVHGERYPIDEDFLAALGRMPAASGVALGFDRLVMLATGAPRIDDVIWTPVVEP